ncbi:type IV secretion system protein B10 [Sphingobium sp. Leaf26]|nr:type IV secretion system protein B10 [Sphingobium sp. Leaf26]
MIDLASGDGLGNAASAAGAAGDDQAVRASVIRNRANLVPQGSMINAVLETPIDSRRPGLVRAVVSRDARGFDGTRVLIPRGSRLIGEAAGDAKAGQRRVLVTWTRLIRPDGVAIRIGSPAADVLGGAGIRGKVNNHFIERFGNAVLQSALTIGVNIASRPRSNSVIVGLPGQIGATGQNLLPNVDLAPTIKVASGAEISVFVARDLDFSGTGLRR